ncbi:MAG: hypothetical protein ACRCWI_02050 [Brevinema sp.]
MKLFLSKGYKERVLIDPIGKIISIVLAIFLWYYVNVISIEKIYISLPISLVNVPQDKIVTPAQNMAVRVEISTHEDVSRRIKDLSAVIDLSEYEVGQRAYSISLTNLPKDIQVKIFPEQKQIEVYPIVTNTVPITVKVDPHSLLTNIEHFPNKAVIIGSSIQIENIKTLSTGNLKYTLPMQSSSLETNLRVLIPNGVTLLEPQTVDVLLQFNQQVYTNTVLLPLEYHNLNSNLTIDAPLSIELDVVTTVSNIEQLLLASELSVNLLVITNMGFYELPLEIKNPSNILFIDPPSQVFIELKQYEIETPSNMIELSNTMSTNIVSRKYG